MFVYAVTNTKGGVGKTTAVATLGAAMAEAGRRVLLLDLDPQASLTATMGGEPKFRSIEDVLECPDAIDEAVIEAGERLWLVPARATLAIKLHEITLGQDSSTRLALALSRIATCFDNVLIDCPSAIGAAMTNGLTAADVALVPLQCNYLSLRGLADVLAICSAVQQTTNPRLRIQAFANLYDARTGHALDVLAEARRALGAQMLSAIVPRSVRIAEAPATGMTVLDYAVKSRGADAYRMLATEILEEEKFLGTTRRHSCGDTTPAVELEQLGRRLRSVAAACA